MGIAPDPADKTTEAAADGAFGGKPTTNRRAGYGDTFELVMKIARKGGSLASGEGEMIIKYYEAEIRRLESDLRKLQHEYDRVSGDHSVLEDTVASLRAKLKEKR